MTKWHIDNCKYTAEIVLAAAGTVVLYAVKIRDVLCTDNQQLWITHMLEYSFRIMDWLHCEN